MNTITIKSIFINSDFKGKPFINKNGRPYKRATITSMTGKKASMYIGETDVNKLAVVSQWKAGDTVQVEIEQVGDYTNFSLPKQPQTVDVSEKPTNAPQIAPQQPTGITVEEIEQAFYGKDPDDAVPDMENVEIPF